jgi:hypothetical protein
MSTTAPKSATTPIPVQLSEPEFTAKKMTQNNIAQFRDYSIFTGFWCGSCRAFVVECWL